MGFLQVFRDLRKNPSRISSEITPGVSERASEGILDEYPMNFKGKSQKVIFEESQGILEIFILRLLQKIFPEFSKCSFWYFSRISCVISTRVTFFPAYFQAFLLKMWDCFKNLLRDSSRSSSSNASMNFLRNSSRSFFWDFF